MITLGLDIGVSSLGTAIVDTQKNQILHTGVYVFPAGKEAFGTKDEKSRNETRRLARQSRRQHFLTSFASLTVAQVSLSAQ